MYLSGQIAVDPSHVTDIVKTKPTKGFAKMAHFLTGGLVSKKEEQETFTAVAILQNINMVLRAVGVNNIVKLAKDDVTFYEDTEGKESSIWSKFKKILGPESEEEGSVEEETEEEDEPAAVAMTETEPVLVVEPGICEKAPGLITEIMERLEELQSIPDPRLRDPRNDVLFPKIYFDFDKSLVKEDFQQQLQKQFPCVLEEVEKIKELMVQVEGHADERGNDEYNIALGHRRANAVIGIVKVYLSDPAKLQITSYGEEFPEVQESNPEAWAKNRRVVFTLLLKSQ